VSRGNQLIHPHAGFLTCACISTRQTARQEGNHHNALNRYVPKNADRKFSPESIVVRTTQNSSLFNFKPLST
jgi:hypothetical protein